MGFSCSEKIRNTHRKSPEFSYFQELRVLFHQFDVHFKPKLEVRKSRISFHSINSMYIPRFETCEMSREK